MPVAGAPPAAEGVGGGRGCTYPPTHPNASLSLLPPSLLSDPSVHSPEIAAGSASEGGWNENGESLLSPDPSGGDGGYSRSCPPPPQEVSYAVYCQTEPRSPSGDVARDARI